jgi:hypothetical protein
MHVDPPSMDFRGLRPSTRGDSSETASRTLSGAVKVDGGGRGVAGQSELRAWLEEAASLVVVIGAVEVRVPGRAAASR